MSGYEEQLHARAEMLEETGELASAVTAILTGAGSAGVDPRAVISLRTAIRELDPAGGAPGYQAGRHSDRHTGGGYRSDGELLEAVSDADDQTGDWLHDANQLHEQVTAAADTAHADLKRAQHDLRAARQDLAAAVAMPAKTDCDGCHSRKAAAVAAAEAAITDAQERISDATRRIGLCEAAAGILGPLTERLTRALARLRTVPQDLGEVYQLIYEFIRSGGRLPTCARWIEGEDAARLPARKPALADVRQSRRAGARYACLTNSGKSSR